jgi:hypothetical protein
MPQAAVSRIERGVVSPTVDTVDRLLWQCGRELEAVERPSYDVDRTLIRERLRLTPSERVRLAELWRRTQPFRRAAARARQREAPFEPLLALRVLNDHGVRFILIGGFAATIRGSPVITGDLDLCYARDNQNLVALAEALQELQAKLRGAPPDLPFHARRPKHQERGSLHLEHVGGFRRLPWNARWHVRIQGPGCGGHG